MSSGELVAENVIAVEHRVAVLVPCYNKAHAFAKVIVDFRVGVAFGGGALLRMGFLSIAVGLILDTVTRGRRELKLLAHLALPAPGEGRRS